METTIKRIPIIPKNSTNLIIILGSFISPSIKKPMVVSMTEMVKMFTNFLFIGLGFEFNDENGILTVIF